MLRMKVISKGTSPFICSIAILGIDDIKSKKKQGAAQYILAITWSNKDSSVYKINNISNMSIIFRYVYFSKGSKTLKTA